VGQRELAFVVEPLQHDERRGAVGVRGTGAQKTVEILAIAV
jgi:hypothetical protein